MSAGNERGDERALKIATHFYPSGPPDTAYMARYACLSFGYAVISYMLGTLCAIAKESV
jgi:hypothetical protein